MRTKPFLTVSLVVAFAIFATASLMSCKPSAKSGVTGTHKMRVITTLFPLYDMARHVGGDKAEVSLLFPPGVEPHSFEPKPTDIVKINGADVFIYTGKFMEPWAEDIIKQVTNKNLLVIDASQGTKMINAESSDADRAAGSPDPHIWLDFDNAKIMVNGIAKAIEAKDSAHKDYYEQNLEAYIRRLNGLDYGFKSTLDKCETKEIIYGGHHSFGYLARRYGLKYMAAQGISP